MQRICVFCGSRPGKQPGYLKSARVLASELVKRNITLVYGGASVGIMGEIADSVLADNGKVIGIIPKALVDKEVSHNGLTELIVVKSMHERKSLMAEYSDGFIALPGGLGTIEELFEVLAWAKLGFHNKPCALLNIEGYYNDLLLFLDKAIVDGFINQTDRSLLLVDDNPETLLDLMASYTPPKIEKLISRDET